MLIGMMKKFIHTWILDCSKTSVTGQSPLDVLRCGLYCLGVDDISQDKCLKLVGIGTDGAAAKNSKKQAERSGGTAYCLEVAIKEVLKGTAFDAIYEFLLHLYN